METALIILLFLAALAYLGRLVWRAFSPQQAGCAKGCGSCAATVASQKAVPAEA